MNDSLAVKSPPTPTPERRAEALGYTIIIDNSSTLGEQLVFIKQVIHRLIERGTPDDGAQLVSFRSSGERRVARFTTDRRVLLESIEAVQARSDGWTQPVIDAMYWSLESAMYPNRPFASRGIVVLTHGMDGVSEHTWDELLALARTHKIPIYCVLFAPESPKWNSYSDTTQMLADMEKWQRRMKASEQYLSTLTQDTGGKLLIPKSEEQLDGFADEIMRGLHEISKNRQIHGRD